MRCSAYVGLLIAGCSALAQTSTVISPGVPAPFSIPQTPPLRIFAGVQGFQVVVPPGSTTLEIRLATATSGIDVDLYARFGQDVTIENNLVVADHRAEDLSGNETLLITTRSTPPLRSGTYFIALGVFNPSAPTGTITASLGNSTNPPDTPIITYAWQSDWSAFMDALAPFVRTLPISGTAIRSSITAHPKFLKPVTWQGVVRQNLISDASDPRVDVTMPDKSLTFSFNNLSATIASLTLRPGASDRSSWAPLRPGDQIRFTVSFDPRGFLTIICGTSTCIPRIDTLPTAELAGAGPAISAVVNGASFRAGITSGAWITISGSRLATSTRIWGASDFSGNRLPVSLDGVSVEINGKAAAVYYISPTQINALAPSDTALGPVNVTVRAPGGSVSTSATLQTYSPGFFVFSPNNGKYLAAVHSDGVFVGPSGLFGAAVSSRPAAPGDRVLLFGTGFGPTTPPVPTDVIFQGSAPLSDPRLLTIRIGGSPATVEFAGISAVGLYQFNIIIPNLAAGDQPIVAEIGGQAAQPNIFLTIRNP